MTALTGREGAPTSSTEGGSLLSQSEQLNPQQHRTEPVWPGLSWPVVPPVVSYGKLWWGMGSGMLAWAVWPSPGKGLGMQPHGTEGLCRPWATCQDPFLPRWGFSAL